MSVVGHHPQVMPVAVVHEKRFVAARKQVAAQSVPGVQAHRVNAQKPFHPSDQIGEGRFHEQMEMVGHQTPRMHLPGRFLTNSGEGLVETVGGS